MQTSEEQATLDNFIDQYDSDDSHIEVFGGMVSTRHIHVDNERYSRILNLHSLNNYHYCIIDNGCDTSLIGKGWMILTSHPTRKANVVGYDDQCTVKRGLPIVSGITAIDIEKKDTILLEIHEAVLNSESQHSLLSDFQLRERVHELDVVSKRHGGKQTLTLEQSPEQHFIIDLVLKQALFTFKIRIQTDEELKTCTRLSITYDTPWDPRLYT